MTTLYAWNTARAGCVAYPNVREARLFHPTWGDSFTRNRSSHRMLGLPSPTWGGGTPGGPGYLQPEDPQQYGQGQRGQGKMDLSDTEQFTGE